MTRQPQNLQTVETSGLLRPVTKKTPDAIQERKRLALSLFAEGHSVAETARMMAIDRWTIFNWLRKDEEFKAAKAQIAVLRDMAIADEMEDGMLSLARGKTTKDGVPHFAAMKHLATITDPKRHGDRKTVEHSGTVVHTLIPSAKRLDELLAADPDIIDVTATEEAEDEE